jgi:hypothetical protein
LADTLRFLQSDKYDCIKTLESIRQHLQWRNENLPKEITFKAMEILNSGFLYVHGRDSRFRPLIILITKYFFKHNSRYTYNDWETAIIYLLEHIIKHLLVPGQIEGWNIICDVQGLSIVFPPKELKHIFNIFFENYKCRLNKMWIVNAGKYRSKMASKEYFSDKYNKNRVEFIKQGDNEIFRNVHHSQVEIKFSGSAINVNDYFFPPIFPSESYFINNEDNNLLITEELYVNI